MKKHSKSTINVLTKDVVRNPNLDHNDFALILYLRYVVFVSGDHYEFEVSAPDLKKYMNIQDNKTLKASLGTLYKNSFLLEPIAELKPNKPLLIKLNQIKFDISKRVEGESFTQLPISVMFAVKDGKINSKEARILYYIKSYIIDKDFCFTSQITMGNHLHMTDKTVRKHTQLLKDKKLLNIEVHKLGHDYQYNDDDRLTFTKYNNHYILRMDNIQNL